MKLHRTEDRKASVVVLECHAIVRSRGPPCRAMRVRVCEIRVECV